MSSETTKTVARLVVGLVATVAWIVVFHAVTHGYGRWDRVLIAYVGGSIAVFWAASAVTAWIYSRLAGPSQPSPR